MASSCRCWAVDARRNAKDTDVRAALTLVVLLGLLLLAVAVGFWAWQEMADVEISRQGLIALALGVVLTFLLGAGLMALVFYSARRGYDERAHEAEKLWRDRDPSG
jgi:heme/copper-type cytochrome/quinol oxidase subunit 3